MLACGKSFIFPINNLRILMSNLWGCFNVIFLIACIFIIVMFYLVPLITVDLNQEDDNNKITIRIYHTHISKH